MPISSGTASGASLSGTHGPKVSKATQENGGARLSVSSGRSAIFCHPKLPWSLRHFGPHKAPDPRHPLLYVFPGVKPRGETCKPEVWRHSDPSAWLADVEHYQLSVYALSDFSVSHLLVASRQSRASAITKSVSSRAQVRLYPFLFLAYTLDSGIELLSLDIPNNKSLCLFVQLAGIRQIFIRICAATQEAFQSRNSTHCM